MSDFLAWAVVVLVAGWTLACVAISIAFFMRGEKAIDRILESHKQNATWTWSTDEKREEPLADDDDGDDEATTYHYVMISSQPYDEIYHILDECPPMRLLQQVADKHDCTVRVIRGVVVAEARSEEEVQSSL